MNKIMRYVLRVTVLLAAYVAAAATYLFPWLGLPLALAVFYGLARKGRQLHAHGTARWGVASDVPHMIRGGDGLILGHIEGKTPKMDGIKALFDRGLSAWVAVRRFLESCQPRAALHLVRLNTSVHTCIFAPTGVGKGVSCVIPHLLTNTDSCVVVDFKGELAKITADARRRMGHQVVLLDPYMRVTQEPDTFNPFDFIDPESELAIDDCRDLAEALVLRTGQEKDPFWNDAAETWLTAMSALLVSLKPEIAANLAELKTLVSDTTLMRQAIVKMIESDAWDGILSRLGHSLTHAKDKELGSTLTSTNRHLRFIDSPAISACTATSSFDPAGLLTGKMTIYLILSPDRMRAQASLLRLWVGSMFRAVIRGGAPGGPQGELRAGRGGQPRPHGCHRRRDRQISRIRNPLCFYIINPLVNSRNATPTIRDRTLLSNTTQVFFGVNDQQTAEYVSNRLGEHTIVVSSGGTSSGGSNSSDSKSGSSSSGHVVEPQRELAAACP